MAFSHDSLKGYYKTNFIMMQHYHYSLTEIDEMMPWEREIYVSMLQQHIEDENERIKRQNAQYNR